MTNNLNTNKTKNLAESLVQKIRRSKNVNKK
jgi:hypothetical protein